MTFKETYANAYDALYQDKDYEKECDFIEAIFKKHGYQPKTILDLGCGTGGHALILAKRGYKVTGIDRSSSMLDIARRKAKNAELEIEFIEGDITGISLNRKFDTVISMFAVMGYQTENDKLQNAYKVAFAHLREKGIFIFDCWNGLAVLNEKTAVKIKEVHITKNEKIIRFTEPVIKYLDHVVETRFKVLRIKNNQLIQETNESHLMRFLFPQEIRYFLEVAGFEMVSFYPFLNLDRDLTERDWNMMVVGTCTGK